MLDSMAETSSRDNRDTPWNEPPLDAGRGSGDVHVTEQVTMLMASAAAGSKDGAERLLPLIYEQLRRAAQQQLARENAGVTLSATGLVHEAYLRLAGPREVPWKNRAHFYSAAAEAMRRILVDRARARKAAGTSRRRWVEARDLADMANSVDSDEIVAFDDALKRLESVDPGTAEIVRLRFFAGLSVDETAQALSVSPRTVDRDWAFARAWLVDAMRSAEE
jgi:RNA polymerase sigma factor (TIGR02999 family)